MSLKLQCSIGPSLLSCLVAACTSAGEPTPTGQQPAANVEACSAPTGLPYERGDLVSRLMAAPIVPSGSEAFQEPGGTELIGFERAFEALLLDGPTQPVRSELGAVGFSVTGFQTGGGKPWVLVEEAASPGRGAGTFVVNLAPARDMWLEAPHADSDKGTLRQTAEQLVELGARALLVTGSHRCASQAKSPCAGTTAMCGGAFRISDTAHFDRNFFTAAHRALRSAFPDALAVQVHGMDSEGSEAAVVSNGTREARPSSLSVRLRDALNAHLATRSRAFSCNDPTEAGQYRPLCGTANVQGALDNEAPDACSTRAETALERFVHVEQNAELRLGRSSRVLLEALADAVPCTLEGSGLGCPARPASAATCG